MSGDFITDMGGPLVMTREERSGEGPAEPVNIGRYGVWRAGPRKANVVATGDDLEALQAEYGPGLPVHELPIRPGRSGRAG